MSREKIIFFIMVFLVMINLNERQFNCLTNTKINKLLACATHVPPSGSRLCPLDGTRNIVWLPKNIQPPCLSKRSVVAQPIEWCVVAFPIVQDLSWSNQDSICIYFNFGSHSFYFYMCWFECFLKFISFSITSPSILLDLYFCIQFSPYSFYCYFFIL